MSLFFQIRVLLYVGEEREAKERYKKNYAHFPEKILMMMDLVAVSSG
jgi:hypothetical protein